MFTTALFTIVKFWKQPKYPLSGSKTVVHLHNAILRSRKKEKFLPFVTTWMELETIMLSEISQSVKNKYHMISLICKL